MGCCHQPFNVERKKFCITKCTLMLSDIKRKRFIQKSLFCVEFSMLSFANLSSRTFPVCVYSLRVVVVVVVVVPVN